MSPVRIARNVHFAGGPSQKQDRTSRRARFAAQLRAPLAAPAKRSTQARSIRFRFVQRYGSGLNLNITSSPAPWSRPTDRGSFAVPKRQRYVYARSLKTREKAPAAADLRRGSVSWREPAQARWDLGVALRHRWRAAAGASDPTPGLIALDAAAADPPLAAARPTWPFELAGVVAARASARAHRRGGPRARHRAPAHQSGHDRARWPEAPAPACAVRARVDVRRELGGALQVESEGVGRGATFTLELPLKSKVV